VRRQTLALLSLAVLWLACTNPPPLEPRPRPSAGATTPEPVEAPPLGRLSDEVKPLHYELELEIIPDGETFAGTVAIDVDLARAERRLWLHADGLTVAEASVTPTAGQAVKATFEPSPGSTAARLVLPDAVGPGTATVRLTFSGSFGHGAEGLYQVKTGGAAYAFTQLEPIWARKIFPCFDEPAFKAPFDVSVVAKSDHRVIANTRELGVEDVGGGKKRVRFAKTEPLPTYLIAFAVGPLDVVEAPPIAATATRPAPLPFRGVAAKGRGPELAYALAETPAILLALEEYFGIAYPFDKLDIIAVPDRDGAMENAGAVTFREVLLLLEGKNAPLSQRQGFAYVMAHELAHQWFGDLVTMPWWNDIWLNEAFATWMGFRTVQELTPEYEAGLRDLVGTQDAMFADALVNARQIRQPVERDDDIHAAFDRITYRKGSGVLGMFERWLGPEVFQKGIQRYMRKHRLASATAEDLLAVLTETAGKDVAGPFNTFLSQAGLPRIDAALHCEGGAARVTLAQSRYLPLGSTGSPERLWQVPVCLRHGKGKKTGEACTLLTGKSAEVALEGACPDWVMPNAGAAGYYQWSLPPADMRTLATAAGSLDLREQVSLGNAVIGSLRAGQLAPEAARAALAPLARIEHADVVRWPMSFIRTARHWLEGDPARADAEELGRAWFRRTYAKLGEKPRKNEPERARMLRQDVLFFLLQTARDPELRQRAVQLGDGYIGFGKDNKLARAVIDSNIAPAIMTAYGEQADAARFDALLVHLRATADEVVRGVLLAAIGSTRDPALAARALDLALDATTLKVNELTQPLVLQLADDRTRPAAWSWLEQHIDALLPRLSRRRAGTLPGLSGVFCSAEGAAAAKALFTPRLANLPGGARELDMTLEAIALCAAQKKALLEGMRAAVSKKP
jgi:alanyl aminopeptidase